MLETIIPEVAKNKIAGILDDILSKLGDEIAQFANNNILEYLVQEYRNCKQTKTILHRYHPVDIDKIYQPLSIRRLYYFGTQRNESASINILDISAVFREHNLITILGDAGCGKSTIVKYLFLSAIRTDYKIPIKVELRYLNGTDKGIEDYIIDNIIKYEHIATSNQIIERMLKSGKFVFFFDGYDELDSNSRSKIAYEISQLTRKYNQNSYIITSRPNDEINLLDGFYNYKVCPLNQQQIIEFIKRQYDNTELELANKIIDSISSSEVVQYRHFLSNPLLLSMFIFTYQTDSHMPQKTSDFYAQLYNTLYSGHDTISKLGYHREKRSGLSKDVITELLEKFSFATYWDSKYAFRDADLKYYLNQIKRDTNVEFDDDAFIHDLYVAINVLVKDGVVYEFPHRSLQEYFAASFVAGQTVDIKNTIYGYFVNSPMPQLASNYNLFLLLTELDSHNFKQNFVIPCINKIASEIKQNQIPNVYLYFRALLNISRLFSKDMRRDFMKIYITYIKTLQELGKDDKAHSNKLRLKQNKIIDEIITPFLMNYDYAIISQEIQDTINNESLLGLKFITGILQPNK